MLFHKKCLCFVAIIAVVFIAVGCASIIHGGKQKININSTPCGATVEVNHICVTTPGVINLSRKEPMYILTFEKDGYEPVEVRLVRTIDGWLWGNVLIGGIIGIAVDYSTGAAYQLAPKNVNVTLKSLGYDTGEEPQEEIEEAPEEMPEEQTGEEQENTTKVDPEDIRVVAVDNTPGIATEAEYYKRIYNTISQSVVKPQGAGSGTVNARLILSSDGALENVFILDSSVNDALLKDAVVTAVKNSVPFPPFPEGMAGKTKKVFTVAIEFI